MKKTNYLVLLLCICLAACGGKRATKPTPAPAPPVSSKPASSKPSTPAPATPAPSATSSSTSTPAPETPSKPGGYYLDDGPDANPPQNLDSIPNAVPKKEPLLSRSNRPYKALGATYKPMTNHQAYKKVGVASWYGKRFHGKKTSSGEVYDMYAMSAAHTILPLPSYVKVTNPANGRSVIVRVNDRGPFKHNREIDLSYVAAYKLGFVSKGSATVEVEAIDTNNLTNYQTADAAPVVASPAAAPNLAPEANINSDTQASGVYVQAGAFKNETYAESLLKRIQGLGISENVGINRVYNNNLHRLKLGPYSSRPEADAVAAKIRRELNVPAITINQ